MPTIKLRFNCNLCKKTILLSLTEEFQAKFKATADKWPYPLVYPHNDHWAFVYLDGDFRERGVVVSNISFTETS